MSTVGIRQNKITMLADPQWPAALRDAADKSTLNVVHQPLRGTDKCSSTTVLLKTDGCTPTERHTNTCFCAYDKTHNFLVLRAQLQSMNVAAISVVCITAHAVVMTASKIVPAPCAGKATTCRKVPVLQDISSVFTGATLGELKMEGYETLSSPFILNL